MAPLAGYATTLKISSASTPFLYEPCSEVAPPGSGVYQVDDPDLRLLDPREFLFVSDTSGDIDPSSFGVDYFTGIVSINTTPSEPVTLSGSALTLVTLVEAKEVAISGATAMAPKEVFGPSYKQRVPTVRDMAVDLSLLTSPLYDHDPGMLEAVLEQLKDDQTPVLFERSLPGNAEVLRAWMLVSETGVKSTPEGLLETSVKLVLAPIAVAQPGPLYLVSYRFAP